MRPEEYRSIIKNLELHYQEFMRNGLSSEMFSDEDKRKMEMHYSGAQSIYDRLVIQLPNNSKTLAHSIHFIVHTHERGATVVLAWISNPCDVCRGTLVIHVYY